MSNPATAATVTAATATSATPQLIYARKPRSLTLPLPPPILSPVERLAYQIAHRLLRDSASYGVFAFREYATPGARRSRQVDAIAGIIMDELAFLPPRGLKRKKKAGTTAATGSLTNAPERPAAGRP